MVEIEKQAPEFVDKEFNELIKELNSLYKNQQNNFAKLSYTIYKIDNWFEENEDLLLRTTTNESYYQSKKLFKALGFSNKQVKRYCNSFLRYVKLDGADPKIKEAFLLFSPSKLFEMLPVELETLSKYINSGELNGSMTLKEIREFLKKQEPKEESPDLEENADSSENDDSTFYILKNDQQRKDFLREFQTWGLWFEESRLGLKYYRLKIGEKTLVAVSQATKDDPSKKFYFMHEGCMRLWESSETDIITAMKDAKDKKVFLF